MIIINPGGPGGSGVDYVEWAGRGIQEIVDSDKHFDIVSFDPRGVKNTRPTTACFKDSVRRQVWNLKNSDIGTIDLSSNILDTKWASAKSLGLLCLETDEGVYPDGSNIRQYVSTVQIVKDMLAIIEKTSEHLQNNFKMLKVNDNRSQQVIQDDTSLDDEKPALLNYWGYSYGSYLGNTFASMYPSRIGRIILDGVVDAPDYASTGWTKNLQDNNKTLDMLYRWCFEAGHKCPLYNRSDVTSSNIEVRVGSFLEGLKSDPIPVVDNGSCDIIRYIDVRRQIFYALYAPVQMFPKLAQILSDLIHGNVSSMIPLLARLHLPSYNATETLQISLNPFNNDSIPYPPSYPHQAEAAKAVLCGDGSPITTRTKAEHQKYVDDLLAQSTISGGIWAEHSLACTGWPEALRPANHNRFNGPFTSRLADYDTRAAPILFIGNTADPVTPLRNAFEMARAHEGSVVLVQDSPGHCAGVNSPSRCTYDAIRRFFGQGLLPEEGTVCAGDRTPWMDE